MRSVNGYRFFLVGWVEPVLGVMGFAIAQRILREKGIGTTPWEGAKPITPAYAVTLKERYQKRLNAKRMERGFTMLQRSAKHLEKQGEEVINKRQGLV
jgi:hypothetical protein